MRICNMVPRVDEEASGPSYSVPRLCESLARMQSDVTLATLQSRGKTRSFESVKHVEFKSAAYLAKLGISSQMKTWFRLNVHRYDIIHTHGLWMMPNIYPIKSAYDSRVPSVISPRGTLSKAAMEYSAKVKALFWAVKQKSALNKATAFHATCQEEYQDIRRLGFKQPVAIIPNGVDLCHDYLPREPNREKTIISLGRIHPKKGLELAIEAWSRLHSGFPGWNLRIVGLGDESYMNSLRLLSRELGTERIAIDGPLYGDAKMQALRSASLFILPTRNENFGMVIAEALAVGTPVITTHGAPWKGLELNECGWWVEISVGAIEKALREAMRLPAETLNARGQAGRNWMDRDFQWASVASRMSDFYRWIRDRRGKLDFVMVD